MANQSVLELAVNVGRWDAGLKKAKQSLDNFTQASGGIQQALEKDSQKMQKFVRMMGNMESTAKTAKGQMNDYKGTIEQLTMQYNRMTDAQKKSVGQDYLNTIDQLKQKYQAVNEEIREMNRSLNQVKPESTGKGSDLGGLMTKSSFKGNVYAYAAEKGAEALNMLKDKITDVLKESMKMSMEAEGIRIAYERLGRPDLMDKLKEATHGTVTELELMKQAVKFNDFRLSLDDMGAMLAFAQQKAKDTGQSIDYMVDSIVTGLGRQSKQILDNLGISAAEIGEKMKTSGDMTKAVAEIIREQMSKSGSYIETSMDRAAQAAVAVQDEMLKLGDQMRETFGTGSIEELSSMLELRLIKDLEDVVGIVGDLSTGFGLFGTDGSEALKTVANAAYWVVKQVLWLQTGLLNIARIIHALKSDGSAVAGIADNIQSVAGGYAYSYGNANVLPEFVVTGKQGGKKNGGRSGGGSGKSGTDKIAFDPNKAALAAVKADETATGSEVWMSLTQHAQQADDSLERLIDAFDALNKSEGMDPNKRKTGEGGNEILRQRLDQLNKFNKDFSQVIGGIGSIASGIEQMGIKLPEEIGQVLNVLQGISSIMSGISAIASLILVATQVTAGTSAVKAIPIIGWALARGGIVHAAGGYQVPGNNYSGDMVPAMLNSGEMVLSRQQQNILAGTLEGNGLQNMKLSAVARGEDLYLVMNRFTRRSGKGELVTWK